MELQIRVLVKVNDNNPECCANDCPQLFHLRPINKDNVEIHQCDVFGSNLDLSAHLFKRCQSCINAEVKR